MPLILVVEPSENLRRDMSEMLIFEGLEVISMNDANVALQMVYEHRPNLIMSEMAFGDFDASDFLKALRVDTAIAATPFVFCTTRTDQLDARKAMFLGADDLLPKPFTAYDFLITVMTNLYRSEIIKSGLRSERDNDIFVNYISTDTLMVQESVDRLNRAGFNLIVTPDRLSMDEEEQKSIIALLRRSRCMVTLFSTDFKIGYDRKFATQLEMRIAHLIGIPIFLVHLKGEEKAIPSDFKRYIIEDARENSAQAFNQLTDRVSKYLAYIKAL